MLCKNRLKLIKITSIHNYEIICCARPGVFDLTLFVM